MICVLVVAAGAAWESLALRALAAEPDVVVLKRCVDMDDLLATATAGQAQAAIVSLDAPGLDSTAVDHLRRHAVRPVAVVSGGIAELDQGLLRGRRIGIAALVAESDLGALRGALEGEEDTLPEPIEVTALGEDPPDSPTGRVIVVWGPQGAPGRTTVAAGIAGVLARRGVETVLVDADPYGGAVAQQLGILEEVSGVLAAARLAASGQLVELLASVPRRLSPTLSVVTGLPRADRWIEVRPGAVEHLLESLRAGAQVVVDTGFSLEEDPSSDFGVRPGRNTMTLAALSVADEVVVVGSSDPVGLARLARALVDLREVLGGASVRVVVNRSRASLGWSERDIAGMVEGFARTHGLHFLPDDQPSVDRALVAGSLLAEAPDSPIGRSLGELVAALEPERAPAEPTRRLRRRKAGRAHRR